MSEVMPKPRCRPPVALWPQVGRWRGPVNVGTVALSRFDALSRIPAFPAIDMDGRNPFRTLKPWDRIIASWY